MFSCWGGAPRAAEGGLLRGLGRGVSRGRIRLDEILGGLSGLAAAAGVLGVEVLNVLTISTSDEGAAGGVRLAEIPLVEKLRRQEIASTSISSSTIPLALTFLTKGESECGRTTPRDPGSNRSSPLPLPLPPYPSSQGGGAGCSSGDGNSGYIS